MQPDATWAQMEEETVREDADSALLLASTLSVQEVAALTDRSRRMVQYYIDTGVLEAERNFRWPYDWRVNPMSLRALIDKPRLLSGPRKRDT